jgi:hypothetical protein
MANGPFFKKENPNKKDAGAKKGRILKIIADIVGK